MTQLAVPAPAHAPGRLAAFAPAVFAGAVFMSAGLVFLVQPMLGKLTLPLLGGSPAVWNTSMAFFQAALLVGYAYAHLLQRLVGSLKLQAAIHVGVLAAAALVLPLKLSALMGPPPAQAAPALWLLGVLALSVGPPFAALSATAPLMQAWYARLRLGGSEGRNPYVLYVGSNLGSLLALAAYPAVVEPLMTLSAQRAGWSLGYGAFVCVAALLATVAARSPAAPAEPAPREQAAPTPWRTRLTWVALAALPSSLMLGVTSHLTTDVASAPFLWVVPLALYLLTFVIAFQARPALSSERTLLWQAAVAGACVLVLPLHAGSWPLQLSLHLLTFFLTALVCHQALAARRPAPARLTEFYLLMSVGGVLGGSFNAFLAPVVFNQVWEYPVVLALAGLARPWGRGPLAPRQRIVLLLGLTAAAAAPLVAAAPAPFGSMALAGLGAALGCAFMLRDRAPAFTALVAGALVAGQTLSGGFGGLEVKRSFFGVHKVAETAMPEGGTLRLLFNGTTIHGGQWPAGPRSCEPIAYYAAPTPIAQAFRNVQSRLPAARMGAVGLGAGAVATYTRPGDTLRFFEIDPAVVEIARDGGSFDLLTRCAAGTVDYRLGDARLTLAREAPGAFDLLLVDAFSSDSVPTHLLTVEAIQGYMRTLTPDGVLVLHLTNRNLDLLGPAAAAAEAAGLVAVRQVFVPTSDMGSPPAVAGSAVMAMARTRAALDRAAPASAWEPAETGRTRPWTDDYTNILGALIAHMRR